MICILLILHFVLLVCLFMTEGGWQVRKLTDYRAFVGLLFAFCILFLFYSFGGYAR